MLGEQVTDGNQGRDGTAVTLLTAQMRIQEPPSEGSQARFTFITWGEKGRSSCTTVVNVVTFWKKTSVWFEQHT